MCVEDEIRSLNRYSLSLEVYGFECDPDEITRILGITPDSLHRKGDRISTFTMFRKDNGWALDQPASLDTADDFRAQWEALLARFEPNADHFRLLPVEAVVLISCAVFWRDHDDRPGLFLTADEVSLLARIGAEIDIPIF